MRRPRLRADAQTTAALVKLLTFAVVTLLATGVLAATISNIGFGSAHTYRALFTDVTGLSRGDDVRVAGVRVGEVRTIKVHPQPATGRAVAEVTLSVSADRPLPRSVRAAVRYRNLVGQRYIALTEGAGSADPLPPGGTIPLAQTQPALDLTVLFDGFKPLFAALSPEDVNRLAYEIIRTLQGEGGTVTSLLAHIASLTGTLADRDAAIGGVVDNLTAVLGTVSQRSTQLSDLIVQLQRFVSGLSADRTAIGGSLASISALEATTANLVAAARPAIKKDIAQLGNVARTLDGSKQQVGELLRRLPGKLTDVTRTATYGSWFNFYLCDFDGHVVLPATPLTGRASVVTPDYHVDAGRCG